MALSTKQIMVDDFVDIAPQYLFKPIELEPVAPIDPLQLDPNSSCDSLDIGQGMLSPIDIFRDSIDGGESMVGDEDLGGYVRRANPINEQQSATVAEDEDSDMDDEEMEMAASPCFRVISPYPFSHASKEEIEEREQLTNVLEWNLEMGMHQPSSYGGQCHVDYSSFFELHAQVNNEQVMAEDCEDFSLSSHEANTLSEDDFLGSISEDPASFWGEEGPVMSDRSQSPTQVSLGSAEL